MSISVFTLTKDCLKQGYPFVESIASVLPVCDELLVSDGFSSDGTYEALQKIAAVNKKVKVYQEKWVKNDPSVIADISNSMRRKCKCDYLFYVQPAEVVHEDNHEMIKALSTRYPEVETFCLPYVSLIGKYKTADEVRLRFCKNLERLVVIGDGNALSTSHEFITSEAKRNLKHPKKFLNLIGRGVEWHFASALNNVKSRVVFLPKPIYRYQALFKANYIERCKGHINNINLQFQDLMKNIENLEGEEFFKKAAEDSRISYNPLFVNFSGDYGILEQDKHPKIMYELLNSKASKYYVRDSLIEEMAKM
jgi:hypothetical protein